MKIIEPNLINTYSCQICQFNFNSEQEYLIIKGMCPLCSQKCYFKLIYKKLSEYSKEDIYYLQKYFNIENNLEDTLQNVVYKVCKEYVKMLLSSINKVTHYSNDT